MPSIVADGTLTIDLTPKHYNKHINYLNQQLIQGDMNNFLNDGKNSIEFIKFE